MNILERIYAKAKENPQKVAFPEAANEKMMQAAYEAGRDGYIRLVAKPCRDSKKSDSNV